MNDLLYFILNGGGWALKPILEKMSVDKIGFFYFSFFRYLVSGIIAIPFILYYYNKNGLPKSYKNKPLLFTKDVFIWGAIVSVIAIAAIMANYYLLEKYNASYVTPIAEGILLIFSTLFSVLFLGEKVTRQMILGIFFIITGVFFIYCKQMNINIL
tara:strand:- start:60 stop:527 length:468 start_codon:yes stop_codon:yes gene_type:complete